MNPIEELSLPNYTAIVILERLGITHPSLEQIHVIEPLVSMVAYPDQIDPEIIRQCVGKNNLAYYFLFVKTNERCTVKSSEQILVDVETAMDEEEVES